MQPVSLVSMNLALLASALAAILGLWGLRSSTPRISGLAGGGVDLKNVWGHDQEEALRKAFAWLTRTGAGRRFPGMPIGWYQQHQVAAIDALVARAKSQGIDDPTLFKTRAGQLFVKHGRKWIDLRLSPRQLFEIADRKARS